MYDNNNNLTGFEIFCMLGMIIIVIICLLTSCGHTIDRNSNEREVVGTVTEKTVKRTDDQDKYLIFVEVEGEDEVQVFEITDNLVEGKLNSSTIYGNIKIGETYTFTIKGSRNKMLSWYPNISKVEKQKKE